jgi:hypothetical protein
MAELRATPMSNPVMGLLADRLKKVQQFGAKPFGYENPPVEMLMGLLGIPAVQQTMERMAYGEPLTTGSGMTTKPRPEAIEAVMSVAPMSGMLAKTTGKATMAAGRAGERLAERVVPQILERGGLPAEMVQAMGTNTRSLLDVYHGTPHTLPPTPKNPLGEFDASKIGTGEGAQAYGYGTYVAENPDVAKSYVKTGMRPIFKVGDENITPVKNPTTAEEKARNYIYDNAETAMVESTRKPSAQSLLNDSWMDAQYSFKDEELSAVRKEIARLIEAKGKKVLKNQEGSLYKVDLPDEKIAKMLDFDKPLKDQTPEIQALAKQYGLTDADHLGGDLVAAMDAKRPAGAEAMRQAGITGIQYFDEGSRGVGKGTRNFVVFPSEEKSMTILERNGLLADQFQALPEDKKKEILNLLD